MDSFFNILYRTKDFLLKGHERSVNIKKNLLIILITRFLSIVVAMIMLPLTIHYLSPVKYGIWLTLSSIVSWIGYFDIGFGNGMRNKFAESLAKKEFELARMYVSTTYAFLSIISFSFLIFFYLLNPFLNWSKILNAPGLLENELSLLAFITVTFFSIQLVLQLITTIATAHQQPAIASLIVFLGNGLSLLIIFILTKTTSGNLIFIGIALSGSPLVIYFLSSIWLFTQEYKFFIPSVKYVKFKASISLVKLGIKFFFLQIATLFSFQVSNLIIAQLFGSEQVTSYNVAFRFFSFITMVMAIVMMPLWSAFTDAWVKKDIIWIKSTMRKLKLLWLFLAVISIIMFAFSNFVYKLWVGPDVIVPRSVSFALCAFVIIAIGNMIFSIFLNGIGKIKLQLFLSFMVIILFVPSSVFFGIKLGLYGVIIPMIILNGLMLVLIIAQYEKIINFKAKGIWAK